MASGDQTYISSYLEMLASERGASQNTLEAYRRDLQDFEGFLSGRDIDFRKARRDDIAAYMENLGRDGLSPASRARRLSAVRQLYKFLEAEGIVGDSPAAGAKAPKLGRPLPKTLSVGEVDRLMEAAASSIAGKNGRELARAVRFHALLEMLYATGMRVSELV
ncbi:MAG: site-specific integrase, partial [Hyphomicrobium sp.]